jgi:alpha/beta superfamily hydrolase
MKIDFPETPLTIRTPRARLSAILHRAPGRRLVILCHGFTGTKSECGRLFVQMARALQKAGINALRFDFMGSGDSSGEFSRMTPNTQIRDARDVLAWAQRRYRKIAYLGFSFGGATAICATRLARPRPDALLTWSAVPSLDWWRTTVPGRDGAAADSVFAPGPRFYTDRIRVDVPEAYVALDLPRLQIQGDRDIAEFRERFEAFCPKNDPRARHLIVPGADHVFTDREHRRVVIAESIRWLRRQLGESVG